MENQDEAAQDRKLQIIEESATMAQVTIRQLMHEKHGEMYLIMEPVDQELSPPELIKILEMAKIEAMRQMGTFD